MAIRRSVRELSDAEQDEFVKAVLALKNESSKVMPGVNTYDTYVVWHGRAMTNSTPWDSDDPNDSPLTRRNSAHRGPAFLPWHREFLRRFEADLQRISGRSELAIPYWDWENDSTFPAFLGGDGAPLLVPVGQPKDRSLVRVRNQEPIRYVRTYLMAVAEGPFRGWLDDNGRAHGWLAVDGNGAAVGPLQRAFGTQEVVKRDPITRLPVPDPATGQAAMVPVTLPTSQDVQHALSIAKYDAPPWDGDEELESFRNVLEGWWRLPRLHNQVHVWVGGSMGPGTSPNDPIFFLHHCNVDRLWAKWQRMHPSAEYEPQSAGPPGHNVGDAMFPWDGVATDDVVRPQDVLALGDVSYAEPASS